MHLFFGWQIEINIASIVLQTFFCSKPLTFDTYTNMRGKRYSYIAYTSNIYYNCIRIYVGCEM